MLTPQQVFDAAWNGLKSQGWQKTGPWDRLRHAPANNGCLKCAHTYAHYALGGWGGITAFRAEHGPELLYGLVESHDGAASPADMEARMRKLAATHSLAIPGDAVDAFPAFMAKVLAPLPVTA
jgi:hypothetical protein